MQLNQALIGRRYRVGPEDAFEASGELIRKFVDAIGDGCPLYRDPKAAQSAGHPGVIAPPTFLNLIPYARPAINPVDDPELRVNQTRGVHGEHRIQQHRPVYAGERVVMETVIADIRRAGPHEILEMHSETNTTDGDLLSTITHTVLVRGERPAASAGTAGSRQFPVANGAAAPPSGLPAQTYEVTMLDLLRYSGATGEYGPTHWSERGARAAGLPGTIAHGMFLMTKAAQALGSWISDPARITDFAVRFSAPFVVTEDWPGTMTVAASAVEHLDDGGTRIHLDVRDGSGKALLTRASAVIAPDLD